MSNQQQQQLTEMKKFMQISEGTWSSPQSIKQAQTLAKLLSKPLPVSIAADKLYHLIGDDDLFDTFYDLEKDGPDTDVRSAVALKLKEWLSDLGTNDGHDWRDPWDPKAVAILKKTLSELGEPLDEGPGNPLDAQNFGTEAEWKEEYAMRDAATYFAGDCTTCAGTGSDNGTECDDCLGTGEIPEGCLAEDENDAPNKMCPVCIGGKRKGYFADCPNCGGEGYIEEALNSDYVDVDVEELEVGDQLLYVPGGFTTKILRMTNSYAVIENDVGQKIEIPFAELESGDYKKAVGYEIGDRYVNEVGAVKHDDYGATPVYENDECTRCFGFGHLPSGDGKECPECRGSGQCPHIDEKINLDDIVENVLQEYPGQPKDHYDPDDDLGAAAQGKSDIMKDVSKELGIDVDMPMGDYENDTIDPEYDDSELGFRFD